MFVLADLRGGGWDGGGVGGRGGGEGCAKCDVV